MRALPLLAVVVLAACSAPDSGVRVERAAGPAATSPAATTPAPVTVPPTTVPAGPPEQAVPAVGECRGPVTQDVIAPASDPRPLVPCSEPHGTETFYVGELPDGDWPGAGDGAAFVRIDEACRPALEGYLGLAEGPAVRVPDRINGYAFYVPTRDDWGRGARWFRCDAYVQPLNPSEETAIAGTLAGAYAAPLPPVYRICESAERVLVSCDLPHLVEWVALVDVPGMDRYPAADGDGVLDQRCGQAVLAVLGATSPRPDLNVAYGLPDEERWEDPANRTAVCVVAATDGRAMLGTVAGIGDTGPLPGSSPAAGA